MMPPALAACCKRTHDGFVTSAPITVRPSPLVLRGDGLGVVEFGQPMASAMPLLEAHFGAPSDEWSYDSSECGGEDHCCFMATGYGCDQFYRSVVWADTGLAVVFSDRFSPEDAVPRFTYWSFFGTAGDSMLATGDGITIGATASEPRAAYGERLVAATTPCVEDVFMFRTADARPLSFHLSCAPVDPSAAVTFLWAGNPGSC